MKNRASRGSCIYDNFRHRCDLLRMFTKSKNNHFFSDNVKGLRSPATHHEFNGFTREVLTTGLRLRNDANQLRNKS